MGKFREFVIEGILDNYEFNGSVRSPVSIQYAKSN